MSRLKFAGYVLLLAIAGGFCGFVMVQSLLAIVAAVQP